MCLQIAHKPAAVLIELPDGTLATADLHLTRHFLHAAETGAEPKERADEIVKALTKAVG